MHCIPNLKMGKILTEKCDYLYIGLNQSYWGKKKKKRRRRSPSCCYMLCIVLAILSHWKD